MQVIAILDLIRKNFIKFPRKNQYEVLFFPGLEGLNVSLYFPQIEIIFCFLCFYTPCSNIYLEMKPERILCLYERWHQVRHNTKYCLSGNKLLEQNLALTHRENFQ